MKKRLVTGLLAHVDAGKTTLSEAMLYNAGSIRNIGRVDRKDAFLDTETLEKERGITIFSKQAQLTYNDTQITILDTPGHVDFSAEMERTLPVLDAAVLLIGGRDGLMGHTHTLWRLLAKHHIPVFLFVNKMDQPDSDRDSITEALKKELSDAVFDMSKAGEEDTAESLALADEEAMEEYLGTGELSADTLQRLIRERKAFPVMFGSALKNEGVREFMDVFTEYASAPAYEEAFQARVYKITRDPAGVRLTHMKLLGGSIANRMQITYPGREGTVTEKITGIREYSGTGFQALDSAEAGRIVCVTGLSETRPGQMLGKDAADWNRSLSPVLTYAVRLPEGMDVPEFIKTAAVLNEEEPELSIEWDEETREVTAHLMGEVQLEILKRLLHDRFGTDVEFGEGRIMYLETIADTVEGVGHFEPLRHYAEVHLLLSPGAPGSGLTFDSRLSTDILATNWQRLIMTHLGEKIHRGVLTGAPLTDVHISLVNGRAHVKHTEGGDFRQATYRAVRQGLMQARSVLLEPWYSFVLTVPTEMTGRAMTDLERRGAAMEPPVPEGDMTVIPGEGPVASMHNIAKDIAAYSKGKGQISLMMSGYRPCHNAEEVIMEKGYDPDGDLRNPSGSVFCTHGAGYTVPWDKVREHMHLELFEDKKAVSNTDEQAYVREEIALGTDEIDDIIRKTFYANGRDRSLERKGIGRKEYAPKRDTAPVKREYKPVKRLPAYLLVDGYNIIFAWNELQSMAKDNVDAARSMLLDIMSNYRGMKDCEVIVVFDAYRVQGHKTEFFDYHNIHVVYTQEAETADQYIERFTHENAGKYDITVATSDGLEQIIIRGAGSRLMSAADLKEEIGRISEETQEQMEAPGKEKFRRFMLDDAPEIKIADQDAD